MSKITICRGIELASNVEIKVRLKAVNAMQKRIERIVGPHFETLDQDDIFFKVTHGRLKLRIENGGHGQLIHYVRDDISGPKQSEYDIVAVPDAERMKNVLAAALGIRGVLKKVRKLYVLRNTRFHLDTVVGLGNFLEFEIVQSVGSIEEEPWTRAEGLIKDLEISKEDLVEGAYIDLLERERR